MNDVILFVTDAPAAAHAAGATAMRRSTRPACRRGWRGAGADEPQVVIFAPTLAHPLQLARSVRAAWHLCELVFVADAAHYDAVARPAWPRADDRPALERAARRATRRSTRWWPKRRRKRAGAPACAPRSNAPTCASPRRGRSRKRAYRRLRLAAHFMVNVLAQTKDGIVGLDTGLRVIQWNDSAARQWRVAQAGGAGAERTAAAVLERRVADAVERVLGGAAATSREHVYTIDGGEAYMEIAVSAVRDDGGQLIGVSLVIRDATDRHARLEQERARGAEITRSLEEKRRQLADMFDLAPGFMAVTRGPDHVFEMANRAYADLFGKRTLAPVSVQAAFPELQGQSFVALRDQVYATGIAYVGKAVPISLREADGRKVERFLDFVYQPLYDADGHISGIFCQGHDVTEQKQLQDGLLMNQAELESLVARRTRDLRHANLRCTRRKSSRRSAN